MRTFARDMSRRATIPVPNNRPEFAASEHFLYTAADDQLRSRTHDGTDRGRWLSSEKGGRASAALCLGHAPRELLFCVLIDDADVDAVDEIVALDARTLKIRYGFGRRLSGLSGLTLLSVRIAYSPVLLIPCRLEPRTPVSNSGSRIISYHLVPVCRAYKQNLHVPKLQRATASRHEVAAVWLHVIARGGRLELRP